MKLKAEEQAQYELFCERVRYMEEQGEVSYWSILFSSKDFADLLDNAMMVEEIMDYDNQVMDQLIALREQIEQDKAELETARQEQQDAKAEQEAAQANLQAQESEVDALLSQISNQEDELEAREAQLRAALGCGHCGDCRRRAGAGRTDCQRAQRVRFPVAPAWPV